jgi:apyrase
MRRYSALFNGRQDTLVDRVHRYRGVLFVAPNPKASETLIVAISWCTA